MALRPVRMCFAISGGGGGRSGGWFAWVVARLRFLPLEGGMWVRRWSPMGAMRLHGAVRSWLILWLVLWLVLWLLFMFASSRGSSSRDLLADEVEDNVLVTLGHLRPASNPIVSGYIGGKQGRVASGLTMLSL